MRRVKRVIFLGLDGLDPKLTERFMAEGKLPNLSRLKEQGAFPPLAHHVSVAVSGRLVYFRHRREPCQAQYF